MTIKNIAKLTGVGVVVLILGMGLGYYYAPTKVKIETKIVEVEKKVVEEHKKTTKEYDPETGKIIKETEETGTKTEETDSVATDKTEEKTREKKHYAIKAGIATDPRENFKLIPRVGAEMRLPFFDSWAGLEGDINLGHPVIGAYIRFEF